MIIDEASSIDIISPINPHEVLLKEYKSPVFSKPLGQPMIPAYIMHLLENQTESNANEMNLEIVKSQDNILIINTF
jgi:hypothetical protein